MRTLYGNEGPSPGGLEIYRIIESVSQTGLSDINGI